MKGGDMKYKNGIFCFLFLLAMVSCEERIPDPVLTPNWLKLRIAELEQQEGGCTGCKIVRYTYNEEFFYWTQCNNSSCFDCEIYYYNGEQVNWDLIDKADFDKSKDRPVILWECGETIDEE